MIEHKALSSTVTPVVRARLFGCPRADTQTRVVTLHPTIQYFFSLMSGINPTSKVAVTSAFAREFYEVSNAPFREDSRFAIWHGEDGRGCRSLSVGDVVEVDFCDGEKWMAVCLPIGWAIIPYNQELISKLGACQTMFDREDAVRGMQPTSHAE